MRKYMVYVDDGQHCFKVAVPANDKKSAEKFVRGNGKIISVNDVTNDFPIRLDGVIEALQKAHYGRTEIDFIARCLEFNDIAE